MWKTSCCRNLIPPDAGSGQDHDPSDETVVALAMSQFSHSHCQHSKEPEAHVSGEHLLCHGTARQEDNWASGRGKSEGGNGAALLAQSRSMLHTMNNVRRFRVLPFV